MKAITLILSILLSFLATSLFAQEFCSEDCLFEIISEQEHTVRILRGNNTMNLDDGRTSAVIPSSVTYNGVTYTVVEIGEQAYWYCRPNIVTLPNTIKRICDEAFKYSLVIEEINLSEGLEFIGNLAFGASKVHEIHIPASVRHMGKAPFIWAENTTITVDAANPYYDSREDCNAIIETATNTLIQGSAYTRIPNSVTTIGANSFNCNYGLSSLDIPASVTTIMDNAFESCCDLEKIELPGGLKYIGDRAFIGCQKLKGMTIPKSVEHIGVNGIFANSNMSLKVEEGNTIYDSREDCNAVIASCNDSLIQGSNHSHIPSSVKQIGHCAFLGCLEIKDLHLPEGLTAVCDSAFSHCYYLSEAKLPSTLTRIGNYGFCYCAFSDIDLPEGLETIGSYAFSLCGNLTAITIPESVKSIGVGAFYSCKSLKEIILPASLLTLSQKIFGGCTQLEKIIIPENVASIGEDAFDGCEGLDSITVMAMTPPEVSSEKELLPEKKYATTILTVPQNAKMAYQSHKVWGKFKNIEESDLTDIHSPSIVNGKSVNSKYYDLSGRRLSTPPAEGIYIRDGKKIIGK